MMDIRHFILSVLLLVTNSNGEYLTHEGGPRFPGTPSQLLSERNGEHFDNVARDDFRDERSDEKVDLRNHMKREVNLPPSQGLQIADYNSTAECSRVITRDEMEDLDKIRAHADHNVDSLVNFIEVMMLLRRKDHEYLNPYSDIFQNYEGDLASLQNHNKHWRGSDSIVNQIRRTSELVQEFSSEFSLKYKKFQRCLMNIRRNGEKISEVIERIAHLKQSMSQTKAMLNMIIEPEIKEFFNFKLTEDQNEIDNLQQNYDLFLHDLSEQATFLHNVEVDAITIKDTALSIHEKIQSYIMHLHMGEASFTRLAKIAKQVLENKGVQERQLLAEIKREQVELERRIDIRAEKASIIDFHKAIMEGVMISEEVRSELDQVVSVERDMQTVLSNSNALLPFLDKASVELVNVRDVLRNVILKSTDMIEVARAGGVHVLQENFRYFLYDDFSEMKCYWMYIHNSIMDLDQSTDYCPRNCNCNLP